MAAAVAAALLSALTPPDVAMRCAASGQDASDANAWPSRQGVSEHSTYSTGRMDAKKVGNLTVLAQRDTSSSRLQVALT